MYFFLPCRRTVASSERLNNEIPWDAGNEGFMSMGKLGKAALPLAGPAPARPPEGEAAPQRFGELGIKMNPYPKPLQWLLQEVPRNCYIKH